jgi:chromosome segregation ATPase
VGPMRALRMALCAILAAGMLASGATSVSANDNPNTDEAIPPGPGLADLKQAIDEFRASLVDLRDACRAEHEAVVPDATTARKRLPKSDSECEKTLKQMRAEFQVIRQQALDLEARYVAGVKQSRIDAAKQKEAEAKAKLEKAQKEEQARQDAAKQEQAKKDAAKKAAEQKPVSQADQLAKLRAKLEEQLKQVDATLAYKQGLWKQSVDAANEYRAKAATLTGADRDRYLAKAAQADKDAAQWASYVKDYTAQHESLVAQLAKLGTTPSAAPKPDELATKRAKLEQAITELNDKIAYKWSESDRYANMAVDLRSQAAVAATQELRDTLDRKADEADKAANDWADLARQYEDQRDDLQAQLDALTKT